MTKKIVYIFYFISFMDLLAVGLTFPILAPYIRSLNASHFIVGVLGSSYSAIQVISGPIIGSWSDIRGRRFILLVTLVLSSICYFILGFCTTIFSVFIIRLVLGLVKHTQTLVKSTLVDFVGNDTSDVFGKIGAFSSLGFVVGPIISGHLAEYENGFTLICTLTSFLFIMNAVLVSYLPDTLKRNGKIRLNAKEELQKMFLNLKKVHWKSCWLPYTLKFCFIYSTTMLFVNQSLYLHEKYDLPHKYVGYSISFISTVGVISSLLFGPITKKFYASDKTGRQRAIHSFGLMAICLFAIYFTTNPFVFLILLLPFGICNAVLRIVTLEMVFKESTDDDRGTLSGASDSIMSFGRFAAPLSAGIISDAFSQDAVIFFAMIPSLIATYLCYRQQYVKVKTV